MQPGDTITPGGSNPEPLSEDQTVSLPRPVQATSPAPQLKSELPQPLPPQENQQPAQPAPPQHLDQELSFQPAGHQRTEHDEQPDDLEISWTASEFINREKSPIWYGVLAGGGIAAAIISYVLTRDIITAVMLVLITIAFGVLAARKPRVQSYEIYPDGIAINSRFYAFAEFRAFSVIDEGAIRSVILLPLKRFALGLTLYSPPEVEDKVYEIIGEHLPFLENYHDPIEGIMRKIHL